MNIIRKEYSRIYTNIQIFATLCGESITLELGRLGECNKPCLFVGKYKNLPQPLNCNGGNCPAIASSHSSVCNRD